MQTTEADFEASLTAAIEGDFSKMAHSDLVLTCKMLTNGRAVWRKEAEDLQKERNQLRAQLSTLEKDKERLARCLGFFASVIKSGESWTETCQREYDTAIAASQKEGK